MGEQQGKTREQRHVLGVLALAAGVISRHLIHGNPFLLAALIHCHLIHVEGQIIAVVRELLHLRPLFGGFPLVPGAVRDELLHQQADLPLILPLKHVVPEADLPLHVVLVHHLAVQLRGGEHLIELAVLVGRGRDTDLVHAVRKCRGAQHPVDLPHLSVSGFDVPVDGGDHVVPQAAVYLPAFALELLLILLHILAAVALVQILVGFVGLLGARQAAGAVGQVELHPRRLALPRIILHIRLGGLQGPGRLRPVTV